MLQRIDLRSGLGDLRGVLPRAAAGADAAGSAVAPLIDDVRRRGAAAVLEASERFDGIAPPTLRVPADVLAAAADRIDPDLRAALVEAISRARAAHHAQRPTETVTELAPGGRVHQRWVPVRRVGLYVPGGLALYPSSVVMNVVPAQVAGVEAIAVTSPPQKGDDGIGWPDGNVLAACALLGVDEVYAAGGAQGVAMLALGVTDTDGTVVQPVDVITGPGNIYVTTAKRLLRDTVAIDSEAGPTEIAIIADDLADPVHVAADLISQAEHDPLAASVLITTSEELADAVDAALEPRVSATRHRERVRTALSGSQSGTLLVSSIADAIMVADTYAAEHLEIQTRDAAVVAGQIRNAGAIFVGAFSPVSLGDYCAGSNHVLPTSGSARYASGLNTTTFLRQMQVIDYSREALEDVAGHIQVLAAAEDLPAHSEAVQARLAGPGVSA